MGDVVRYDDAYSWSISKIATAFGFDRRTVSSRLKSARVEPAGVDRGHPKYRLKDAAAALFEPLAESLPTANDPDRMQPKERKDWFDSERSRIQLEKDLKELVAASDAAREMAVLVKAIINPLDGLADTLERKLALSAEQLDVVQNIVDSAREQMYMRAVEGGADIDEEASEAC